MDATRDAATAGDAADGCDVEPSETLDAVVVPCPKCVKPVFGFVRVLLLKPHIPVLAW